MNKPQLFPSDDLDMRIEALMLELHVPAHLKGFQYLKRAIYIVFNDHSALHNVVDGLYHRVAVEFGTDKSRLERDARTALEHVPISCCDAMFERALSRRNKHATPKEFIALCAQKLSFDDMRRGMNRQIPEHDGI